MNMDPFSKDAKNPFAGPGQANPEKDDVFVKRKPLWGDGGSGGGIRGNGARSGIGGGNAGSGSDAESMDTLEIPEVAEAPEPEKKTTVLLRNPRWEANKVGFNEEAQISAELELPPELAHKTKVSFELFAKTPKGPEKISTGDGIAKEGKAICAIPVFIPNYRDEDGERMQKVEYYFTAKHSDSELLDGSKTPKLIDEMAERLIKTHILPDVTFAFDKSFLLPGQAAGLKAMSAEIKKWQTENPEGKLAVFGHADTVGKQDYNKSLSQRRAKSVLAFLTNEPKGWEDLSKEEKWGLAPIQDLLRQQGHDPGASDGQDGPKTQAAVKSFQTETGLPASGNADENTRSALFKAFMEACDAPGAKARDFDDINGSPSAGCSEFNLIERIEGSSTVNRRVTVLLVKSNKNFPITYPCQKGDVGPCKKQVARKGDRRTAGFGCYFYDKLVVERKEPEPEIAEITELAWEKPTILAWDDEDNPEMKTKVKVKTRNLPACKDAVFEIIQYSSDGAHLAYKKIDGLNLEGDVLFGPDGKELEIKLVWHDTIYDYRKTQYYCRLQASGVEKSSGQEKDSLLRLLHYDSIVANPSGDLPGAEKEGVWVANYLENEGPWMDATKGDLIKAGHKQTMFKTITTRSLKVLLEKNKFIHHQSSHGTAYCMCSGSPTYFEDTKKAAMDGAHDWACPVCKKSTDGIGVIYLTNWDNLFFKEEVLKLAHAPKILLLANCCLTATSSVYADAWLAKGTRWYIGWAIPVGDTEAVEFAKAFYRRWMVYYKMDPDSVRKAYNDVKGPYAIFRPRIFGR